MRDGGAAAKHEIGCAGLRNGVNVMIFAIIPEMVGNDGGVDGTRTRGLCRDSSLPPKTPSDTK
jgi:hypothetical protein